MDLMTVLTEWSARLSGLLWGNPLTLIILLGTGLYLTVRMGLVQIRGFRHAIGLISGRYDRRSDDGQITHFQALSTALSATIGTGNIAGVATAITLGGPGDDSLTGAALTAHAFSGPLGQYGAMIVGFGLALFAYSTIIAWPYYGDRSAYYLFGERAVLPYRILFTLLVAVGAAVPLNLVWNIANTTNILMALPNLLGLILLAGLVNKLKNEYFSRPQTPTR